MRKILTTEEFIRKAKKVHENRYNYSKVKYKKSREKVIIICNKHNKEFQQTPDSHLRGGGCSECGYEKNSLAQMKSARQFIRDAINIHGNKYNYAKVKYKNCKSKVIIICPKHGEFKQEAKSHLSDRGCPLCGGTVKKRESQVIKEFITVHGNRYNYSEVDYKNDKSKVIIICPIHGKFKQTPNQHLRGCGCFKCGRNDASLKLSSNTFDFVKKANGVHKDKYNYDKTNYIDNCKKIKITCFLHGDFLQGPNHHLRGHGCPSCLKKNEGEVKGFLLKYFKEWDIVPNKKIWDKYKNYNHKRYCDFWLEKNDIRIIVEYDGEQHFRPVSFGCKDKKKVNKQFERIQKKDKLDIQFCKENNIILHRIKYNEDKEISVKNLKNKLLVLRS